MIDKTIQKIKGNNNHQAGRDIINHNYYFEHSREPIIFNQEDIKNVIICFDKLINKINSEPLDMSKIPIEEKNEINKLSEDYFELIKEESLEYFSKIDSFLKDPKNKEYLKMYTNTAVELKHKITINRKKYDCFEEILEELYDSICYNDVGEINFDKRLIWVFLNYMYCNCDIGKKVKEE